MTIFSMMMRTTEADLDLESGQFFFSSQPSLFFFVLLRSGYV
jgi:hypothetical protein